LRRSLEHKQIRALFLFTTLLLSIVFVAAPGRAAVVCTHSDATVTAFVTLDAAGDMATIGVGPGYAIQVNGESCETATTTNTEVVIVTGNDGDNQAVVIDGSGAGGAFPGSIEFQVALAGGTGDRLTLKGPQPATRSVSGRTG
jgi:hypothetical protein